MILMDINLIYVSLIMRFIASSHKYVQRFKTVTLVNSETDSGYPNACVILHPKESKSPPSLSWPEPHHRHPNRASPDSGPYRIILSQFTIILYY